MGQTTNRNWKAGFLPSTVSSTDLVASNHQRWTKVWDTSWIASMACHPNTRSKGGSPTGCQKCDMNHTFSWLVQKPAPTNNGLWYNPPTTRWYDVIRNIKQPTGMGFFSSLLTSFIRKSPFFASLAFHKSTTFSFQETQKLLLYSLSCTPPAAPGSERVFFLSEFSPMFWGLQKRVGQKQVSVSKLIWA